MSILTKICAIILVVLVLLACPVFINIATVPYNYRDLYQQQKRRADVLMTQAATIQLARGLAVEAALPDVFHGSDVKMIGPGDYRYRVVGTEQWIGYPPQRISCPKCRRLLRSAGAFNRSSR